MGSLHGGQSGRGTVRRVIVGPPGSLVGIVVAIGALNVLGGDFALFASGGGVLFAAVGAFWIGAGIAALIDPARAGRNAALVAISIVACVVLFIASVSFRPASPGTATRGQNVFPPAGAPNIPR
jgi:hypothetical protein